MPSLFKFIKLITSEPFEINFNDVFQKILSALIDLGYQLSCLSVQLTSQKFQGSYLIEISVKMSVLVEVVK